MQLKYFVSFLLSVALICSCTKPPEYPIVPEIEFLGFSKNAMQQGALNEDSLLVRISFTDGDGDLGDRDSLNLFITDSRTGFLENSFQIPFIPEQGASNGISGEITFALFTTCCIFEDRSVPPCTANSQEPTNELIYSIFIKDRAGHMSNEVNTAPITLLCN